MCAGRRGEIRGGGEGHGRGGWGQSREGAQKAGRADRWQGLPSTGPHGPTRCQGRQPSHHLPSSFPPALLTISKMVSLSCRCPRCFMLIPAHADCRYATLKSLPYFTSFLLLSPIPVVICWREAIERSRSECSVEGGPPPTEQKESLSVPPIRMVLSHTSLDMARWHAPSPV